MKLKLWHQIVIALIAGIVVGWLFKDLGISLKPLGDFFFRLIKMLIVPLIFLSLVVGMTSMEDTTKMGRMGIRTFILYMITTAIAIIIGIAIAFVFKLGKGVDTSAAEIPEKVAAAANAQVGLVDTILNLIPNNIVQAMADTQILQIIVFALLFGYAINKTGEAGLPIKRVFNSAADAIYSLTAIVMKFAPIGVFGVMAWAVAQYGPQIVGSLFMVCVVVYVACAIHAVITYSGFLAVHGLSPLKFFKGVIDPAVFAFVSTSSSGTLPVSIQTVRQNFGVSNPVASFVLPLGATINMDGTAIYQGVCAIFIANAFGIDLTTSQYGMIVLMSTLASIGTAGAPGAGLIMLSGLLVQVGLPLEGIGLIFAIDRVLDMARTCVNVVGDNMVATVVAKSEGEMDIDVFNGLKEGTLMVD